jgi:hypothetical protein
MLASALSILPHYLAAGGALTLASGVLVDEVDTVVPFYGIPDRRLAKPEDAKKPVQGHFGIDGPSPSAVAETGINDRWMVQTRTKASLTTRQQ